MQILNVLPIFKIYLSIIYFSAITTSNAQYPHYPNMLIPPQHQPPLAPTLMAEPPGGGGPGGAQTLAQQPMPPNMYQPISQNNPIMNNFVNYPPAHTQPPPGNYFDDFTKKNYFFRNDIIEKKLSWNWFHEKIIKCIFFFISQEWIMEY